MQHGVDDGGDADGAEVDDHIRAAPRAPVMTSKMHSVWGHVAVAICYDLA